MAHFFLVLPAVTAASVAVAIEHHTGIPLAIPGALIPLSVVVPPIATRLTVRATSHADAISARALGDRVPHLVPTVESGATETELVDFETPGVASVKLHSGEFYRAEDGQFTVLSLSLTNDGIMPAVLTRTTMTPRPPGKLATTRNVVAPGATARINAAVMTPTSNGYASADNRYRLTVEYSDAQGIAKLACVVELDPSWGARLVSR